MTKVAVITPYYKESIETLQRCHKSVLAQQDTCTHFIVADGHPRTEINSWDCQHIVLPVAHADNGNTPRGVGSLCAMNEDYDVICYLDADNWYAEDHLSSILYTHSATEADVVFSYRHIIFPDGEILTADDPEDLGHQHVDTSCMAIFPPAFRSLSGWCQMPKTLAPLCDRVMFQLLTNEFHCAWTEYKSVFFETWYAGHFRLAARSMPENVRYCQWPFDAAEAINEQYRRQSYRPCLLSPLDETD